MNTPSYNRSSIISYSELSAAQKANVISCYYQDEEQAENDSFVMFDEQDGTETALPLSMFMRMEHSKLWDGVFGTSAFSGYFIKIGRSGDEVLIAERFC